MTRVLTTISILKSWLFWKEHADWLKKKFDYNFPDPEHIWVSRVGEVCPIENNAKNFYHGEDRYYCVCALLGWAENQQDEWATIETYASTTSLKEIKPWFYYNEDTKQLEKEGAKDLVRFKKYLYKWIEKPDSWMFIQGGFGSGKTHMLKALKTIYPELILYISMDKFSSLAHKSLNVGNFEEIIQKIAIAPILILDDWGIEHSGSKWTVSALARVVNTRHLNGSKDYLTIISTNLKIDDLVNSPDINIGRTASRMIDPDYSRVFYLSQRDYRNPDVRANMRPAK